MDRHNNPGSRGLVGLSAAASDLEVGGTHGTVAGSIEILLTRLYQSFQRKNSSLKHVG